MKIVIIGDFPQYNSKSMEAYILEFNRRKSFFFVSTERRAIEKLS
ncbi:DUF4180 domain-containing protein [Enterococcus gilvus]